MSALILFLYSKYYPNISILLNIVSSIDFIHTLCIDNKRVREVIMRSSVISAKKVPCFVVIFPDKTIHQYVGEDMATFMESIGKKQNEKVQVEGSKTPINRLVENVPETKIDITEENDDDDSENDILKELEELSNKVPSSMIKQNVENKKLNKTDIGSLINFKEAQASASNNKKSSNVSRSRSDLMNRENVKIARGKGHENMNSSSLGTDISLSKTKESPSNIIEDIETDQDTISFSPDENLGVVKNTHKSKQDLKSIAAEMANARDVVEK
jgi:hypothetical protein